MAGDANPVDAYGISKFIISSGAVYSDTMPRKISSPYAFDVTDERICDSTGARIDVGVTRGSLRGNRSPERYDC
jgi:hypothetical protein